MPDKPRCGDCRFWGFAVNSRPVVGLMDSLNGSLYRRCSAVRHESRIMIEEATDSDPSRPLAAVCDYPDYAAALVCREDFGCVLFEGKSNESEPIRGIEDESPFWAPWHKTNG